MDVSRLIFRKETKDNMKSELNISQKGKLRWEKIKEAEKNGSLSMAKNRYEVANLAGFTNETRTRGYQWVANMVQRKHLQEIINGADRNGRAEYEYHILDDPDYNREKARTARMAGKNRKAKHTVEPEPVLVDVTNVKQNDKKKDEKKATIWVDESDKNVRTFKVEFSNGGVVARVELEEYYTLVELIKDIMKGE